MSLLALYTLDRTSNLLLDRKCSTVVLIVNGYNISENSKFEQKVVHAVWELNWISDN